MEYRDLREFLSKLEAVGQLKRVSYEVDPKLEITEICDRTLKAGGPALLFENPKGSAVPLLANLFGTPERVALGMGADDMDALRELGKLLAFLKEPDPPKGIREAFKTLPIFKKVLDMAPKEVSKAPFQADVKTGSEITLDRYPIQTCWPEDAAPLITFGLVITKGPHRPRQNMGIYRMQVLGPNKIIMRWLAHRGGALDFREWREATHGEPFPVAVAIGADPATLLAAVTPIPDSLSEHAFAGLLRGSRGKLFRSGDLLIPESAEILLEGYIGEETAIEGPFGDHTGYYNEQERFPVMEITRISQRENAIYHSTYTGRPPDEPAILGVALNELLIPMLKKQFPEILDFYLPPEACSYRMAVVSMRKSYAGHAKRVMFGVWSYLRQFMYTKFVIVVDEDINVRDHKDVIWAIATRVDAARDCTIIENTPIDYLDFASPVAGLGSKMGIDATRKWPEESTRQWGKAMSMSQAVRERIDQIWQELGI